MSKIICGVIFENDEYSPIYASAETGDFFYPDAVMGDYRAITGISASNPKTVDIDDAASEHAAKTYGDCIGLIYEEGDVILLTSDTAAKYCKTELVCEIDIYSDYDDEDELAD